MSRVFKVFLSSILICTCFAFACPSYDKAQTALNEESVDQAYHDLLKYFYHPLNSKSLIQSAVLEVNRALGRDSKDDLLFVDKISENSGAMLVWLHHFLTQASTQPGVKIDLDRLTDKALNGFALAVQDPGTRYLPCEGLERLTGKQAFGGTGIWIYSDGTTKMLKVMEVINQSPAFRAGIKPGDSLLKIDNQSLKGLDKREAVNLLQGSVDSNVSLTLRPRGSQNEKTLTIRREVVKILPIFYEMKPENVAYIRIRNFSENIPYELDDMLYLLDRSNVKAYILDLRNNSGGPIDAAVNASERFLPRGAVITSLFEGSNQIRKVARGTSHLVAHPILILVNEQTAAAAEIFAGALQDNQVAFLLGTKTYGDGKFQTFVKLPNEGAIQFTIGHVETPKGLQFDGKGLIPNLMNSNEVDSIGSPNDTVLNEALQRLNHVPPDLPDQISY